MTPRQILETRETIRQLQAQAEKLETDPDCPRDAALAIRSSVDQLRRNIAPFCWGCGKILTAVDCADHFCQSCVGLLPLDYPGGDW